jgi:nucleolar protein 9
MRAEKEKRSRGGEGGGHGDGAAYGISEGGFEDKRKYRVDAETSAYFQEIAALVTPAEGGEELDGEQRTLLVCNALGEAAGRELPLALDPTCSRVLQSLLAAAPASALVAYLAPFGQGGLAVTLVTNPFGSHVSETLFGALRAALAPEAAPDAETLRAAREAMRALCDTLAQRALHLVAHRAASPALRALLGLLSGKELGRREARERGAGDAAAGAAAAAVPPGRCFGKLLHAFVDACLTSLEESGEYGAYVADPACSAFLQAVAAAYEGHDAHLLLLLPRLLGAPRQEADAPAPEPGHWAALVAPSSAAALLRDAGGSRLVEAVLRSAPRDLRAELHARFMAGSLRELAAHACANFAVQALLRALRPGDEKLLRAALDELAPDLARLLAGSRGGVVCALLGACAAVGAMQKEAASALARGVVAGSRASGPAPAAGERDNSAYVAVLAPAMLRGAAGGATRAGFSLHGCAALATVLAFPAVACRQYADSVAAISPEEAAAAACDSAASRALEAMLRGGAPPGLKRKLLCSLQPRWAALAASPAGSHVVEAAYEAAESREREALVGALGVAERTLAASRYGAALLRNLGVAEFKRDPAAWRQRHAAAAQVRASFAELLAEEPQIAKRGADDTEGAPAKRPKSKPASTGASAPLSAALQKALQGL